VFKYLPLLLLASAVVAAPRQPKEGLVSHSEESELYFDWAQIDGKGQPRVGARLQVRYTLVGQPGDKLAVEWWLGRTGDTGDEASEYSPYHFDDQEVTIPEGAGKLVEAKGKFDRRGWDRQDYWKKAKGPLPRPFPPGKISLFAPKVGGTWDCRLVVKKDGKVLTDTGYYRVRLRILFKV
jgi:predicted DNA-binding WGR domain protein